MHRILEQVCAIAERERAEWLPEVTPQQLEQGGAVFYMNSQNGTEFDWYVNDRLPSFMVFYNDKANLGAVKLHLNRNGTVSVYLYGEQGARLQKQETLPAEYTEEELLGLAVQLRQAADDQRRWDADIRLLAADGAVPEAEAIQQFQSHGESYAAMRQRRMLLAQNAIVTLYQGPRNTPARILHKCWMGKQREAPTGMEKVDVATQTAVRTAARQSLRRLRDVFIRITPF